MVSFGHVVFEVSSGYKGIARNIELELEWNSFGSNPISRWFVEDPGVDLIAGGFVE